MPKLILSPTKTEAAGYKPGTDIGIGLDSVGFIFPEYYRLPGKAFEFETGSICIRKKIAA